MVKDVGVAWSLRVERVDGESLWVNHEGTKGWIKRSEVGSADQAIELLTVLIRDNPQSSDLQNAYYLRGLMWNGKKEYSIAIRDYNDAIRLDPQYDDAYYSRGNSWAAKGDHNNAIADFNEALRLNPQDGDVYSNRGYSWMEKGEHDKAIAD